MNSFNEMTTIFFDNDKIIEFDENDDYEEDIFDENDDFIDESIDHNDIFSDDHIWDTIPTMRFRNKPEIWMINVSLPEDIFN